MKQVYIKAANQVSIQQPLSEEWMVSPEIYEVPYTRSLDPNFRDYLNPLEARRMGKLLKRALVVSLKTLHDTGIEHPDAIITGTGLGCIENTEKFLDQLCRSGEELLTPTIFMQSTHNTISSLLAIQTKTHGYNVTYSQKGMSFDSALLDAFVQFRLGKIETALVGGHDEMTPSYFTLLQRIGYVGGKMNGICGEAAVCAMLSTDPNDSLCRLASMRMLHCPDETILHSSIESTLNDAGITLNDIDAVVTGINGNETNDMIYNKICNREFGDKPLLRYKNLFGECYSASGFGIYVAAHCITKGFVPQHLRYGKLTETTIVPLKLLVLNQYDGKNVSLIILTR